MLVPTELSVYCEGKLPNWRVAFESFEFFTLKSGGSYTSGFDLYTEFFCSDLSSFSCITC